MNHRQASLLLASAAVLAPAAELRADCDLPPFAVVWTYPEEGAADVPVNSQLWVLTSAWGAASGVYTLNGAELEAGRRGNASVLRPDLAPSTDYTLHFSALATGPFAGETFELHFRTGERNVEPPAAPELTGSFSTAGFPGGSCGAAVSAQDCFDTGQDTFLGFHTRAPGAVAFHVVRTGAADGYVLPASCDGPGVYTQRDDVRGRCFSLHTVGEGGLLGPASEACADVPPPQQDASSASPAAESAAPETRPSASCSLTHAPCSPSALLAPLAALYAVVRRRRR